MIRAKPGVEGIQPYQGGKPIEEVQRELGVTDITKLASNENPLGPSPFAVEAIAKSAAQVHLYPDGNAYYLKAALAGYVGVSPEHLILGNGSNDVLQLIGETYLSAGDEVIYAAGAFVVYSLVTKICGAKAVIVPMLNHTHQLHSMADAITEKTKVIFIANPNNPTGTMVTAAETMAFMARVPEDVLVVFDEAYYEYVMRPDYPQTLPYVVTARNVIITRTFSKIYGLAGLRIGYGIAPPALVEMLNRVRQPFNCNLVGQTAALAALKDSVHVQNSQTCNEKGKTFLYSALGDMGLRYIKTEGNFIMVFLNQDTPNKHVACYDDEFERQEQSALKTEKKNQLGVDIAARLMRKGVIVRPMAGYGYPDAIRVTIGTQRQNERFIAGLVEVIS